MLSRYHCWRLLAVLEIGLSGDIVKVLVRLWQIISLANWKFINRPDGSSNGGIVIFHRSTLSVHRILIESSPTTFEALAVSVSSPRGPLTIQAVYRLRRHRRPSLASLRLCLSNLRSTTRTSLSLAISVFTWRIPFYQLQLNFAPS